MKPRFTRFAAVWIILAFLAAPSALAQDDDADDVRIRAKRVTIEVDGEGRVLLDGKRLSNDRGEVMLRVEPENGDVEVEVVGPRRHHVVVSGAPHGRQDRAIFRRGHDGAPPPLEDFAFDFTMPDIPDVGPLMERFRFEVGDPIRESLEEHREVAALERRSRELARKAREAQGSDRKTLEAELQNQLDEIFAKKLELRERRIAQLEEKLTDERQKLERRRAARDEMIERRLRTLLGEDDILDW